MSPWTKGGRHYLWLTETDDRNRSGKLGIVYGDWSVFTDCAYNHGGDNEDDVPALKKVPGYDQGRGDWVVRPVRNETGSVACAFAYSRLALNSLRYLCQPPNQPRTVRGER